MRALLFALALLLAAPAPVLAQALPYHIDPGAREIVPNLTAVPSIRFLTELPSKPDPAEIAVICLMAVGFSFLATLYPALKAANTDPVEVLRYE